MTFDRPFRIFLLKNDVLAHYKKQFTLPVTSTNFSVDVYVVHCMYLCAVCYERKGNAQLGCQK